jgi:hypothetical protein
LSDFRVSDFRVSENIAINISIYQWLHNKTVP